MRTPLRNPALTFLCAAAVALLACTKDKPAAGGAPAQAPAAAPTPAGPPGPTEAQVQAIARSLAQGLTLDANDPATCAPCHTAVVAEWQDSLHSRSHHASDPLYGALRALRTEKQGPQIPGACAQCHNPRDTQDHDSAAARTGVSCATCHQLASVDRTEGKKGVGALVAGPDKVFRGTHDIAPGTAPLHESGKPLAELVDGKTLCLACHDALKNPAGVESCTTGVEYGEGKEAKSCVECHMPEVNAPNGPVTTRQKHRSHRFFGPHHALRSGELGVMATAVAVSGRFEGDALVVKVENKSGHAFPTGFPGRVALLDIRAQDAAGKEIYRNFAAEPVKDHPEAVFNKGYADADGKPALAAFATKLVRDTRLKPAEVREVKVNVPKEAVKAELRIRFLLAGPLVFKTLAYDGPETKPLAFPAVTVTR